MKYNYVEIIVEIIEPQLQSYCIFRFIKGF